VQLLFELCGLLELVTFVDEIPARNTAETSVSNVAAADAVRSSTPDATTMSRATRPRLPTPCESCAHPVAGGHHTDHTAR
jgi:hypothetical protein